MRSIIREGLRQRINLVNNQNHLICFRAVIRQCILHIAQRDRVAIIINSVGLNTQILDTLLGQYGY